MPLFVIERDSKRVAHRPSCSSPARKDPTTCRRSSRRATGMSIHTYVHQYSELLLLRCLRKDLTVAGIQKRIEVVLARHLHVLDVLLERLRHRRGEPPAEEEPRDPLPPPALGQPPPRPPPSGPPPKAC